MGFLSGLTANGLLGAVGRMASAGGGPFAGSAPASGPGPRDLLDRLRTAMDPERLAIAQALLAGDYGAVSRITEPLRRRRLAEQAQASKDRFSSKAPGVRFDSSDGGGDELLLRGVDNEPIGGAASVSSPTAFQSHTLPWPDSPAFRGPSGHPGPGQEVGENIATQAQRALRRQTLPQAHSAPTPRLTGRSPPPPSQRLPHGGPTGWLADYRETGGRGMRTISSGAGDPGGVSVGRFQVSRDTLPRFLASNEGAPWRNALRGLHPGGAGFEQAWNRILDRQAVELEKAQYRFLYRENYSPPAAAARRSAGFDISAASPILQEVVWSMSNNAGPGHGARILTSAIDRADRQHRRSDPRHQEAVIRELYSGWIDRLTDLENQYRNSQPARARTFRNMATATVPEERDLALEAYRK